MNKLIDGEKYWLGSCFGVYNEDGDYFVLGNCVVYRYKTIYKSENVRYNDYGFEY